MRLLALTVMVLASMLALHGVSHAQTPIPVATAPPTETSKDVMRISGEAPVAPGATVTVEALDPATIRSVTCATTTSVTSAYLGAGLELRAFLHVVRQRPVEVRDPDT